MIKKMTTPSLVLTMAMVLLSGCAEWEKHAQSTLPPPQPAYADKQIIVAPTRSVYTVSYTEGALKPSADELGYLHAFLDMARFDPTEVPLLVAKPTAKATRLDKARIAALTTLLKGEGYKVVPFTPEQPGEEGTVQVGVDHLMAYAPNCPNWEMHPYEAFGEQPSPNHGCADRTNLAAMVANPRDLVAGRVLAAPTGHPALRGEVNYRNDTIKALIDAGDIVGN